jgi:hypothetical protein
VTGTDPSLGQGERYLSDEFLGDRKKSLEESFFAKQNAALLEKMRAQREKQSRIDELTRASEIRDPVVVEKLVELGLDAASWAALSLVPLVEVAWADGAIERRERDAILAAAAEQGIEPDSPSRELLESWLDARPPAALFAAWGGYATGLAANLSDAERATLRREIVERARKVAQSAGGMLGLASISDAEKRVIAALEKPFA